MILNDLVTLTFSCFTDPAQKSKKQLFKSLCPIPSPEPTIPAVIATYDVKPSLNGDLSSKFVKHEIKQLISKIINSKRKGLYTK